ncbi:hypothetical protein KJY73_21570 [Bowmanella sp. Y26]|uniref:hypothetical protein n=1 Tax=Bowmanella yangjiangensis TaxID=2811230 RepID=UPI001BDBDBB6|nr:hypothetical protein [Bowmanella yangjiangensis]MBT1066180.1 hypothetical protein [Bowmanella yangjiangensis]
MLVLTLLFAVVVFLLLYSLAQDKGKNTKHFRNMEDSLSANVSMKKKALRMGDSLF